MGVHLIEHSLDCTYVILVVMCSAFLSEHQPEQIDRE